MSEAYIEKEVPKITVKDVLYSSKFDNNYNVRTVRKHLDTVYSVYDILGLDQSKIDKLIDSKISKSVMTKVSINIMKSLRDGTNYELFNIDDYCNLVDENIDDVVKIDIPIIGNIGKKKIADSLKDTGNKIIRDIPDTNSVTKKMSSTRKNVIYILSNEDVRSFLLMLDIIFIVVLFYLHKSISVLLEASKLMIITDSILLIFNLLLVMYASKYSGEWLFIKRAVNFYNYSVIYNEIIYLIGAAIFVILYKIIKRVISE